MRIEDLPYPETATTVLAREVCHQFHTPSLVNHCERAYLFAAGYGQAHGLAFDPELLYVAAMVHDIGLTEEFDNHTAAFEVAGGSVGWVFAAGAGWPPARRTRVSEIIVRHMWSSVDPAVDVEGHLLELATSLDITGSQQDDWPIELRTEIVRRVPRLELATEFGRCFAEQARRKPDSNAARSVRNGIVERLAANPLQQLAE